MKITKKAFNEFTEACIQENRNNVILVQFARELYGQTSGSLKKANVLLAKFKEGEHQCYDGVKIEFPLNKKSGKPLSISSTPAKRIIWCNRLVTFFADEKKRNDFKASQEVSDKRDKADIEFITSSNKKDQEKMEKLTKDQSLELRTELDQANKKALLDSFDVVAVEAVEVEAVEAVEVEANVESTNVEAETVEANVESTNVGSTNINLPELDLIVLMQQLQLLHQLQGKNIPAKVKKAFDTIIELIQTVE